MFAERQLKIAPNSATLDDIYPTAFKVCGKVKKLQPINVQVNFINKNDEKVVVDTDNNGDFCTYLSSGDYSVKVTSSASGADKLLW